MRFLNCLFEVTKLSSVMILIQFIILQSSLFASVSEKDPCRDDYRKYCLKDNDLKKGRGQCFKKNKEKLSKVCNDHIATKAKLIKEKNVRIFHSCKEDIESFCSEFKGKGMRRKIKKCLKTNVSKLKDSCKETVIAK